MTSPMRDLVEQAFIPVFAQTVPERQLIELKAALTALVLEREQTWTDSEGNWPQVYSSCPDCTNGVVPTKYNFGPCPYHNAKRLLASK